MSSLFPDLTEEDILPYIGEYTSGSFCTVFSDSGVVG